MSSLQKSSCGKMGTKTLNYVLPFSDTNLWRTNMVGIPNCSVDQSL